MRPTRINALLGIEHPLLQGGMTWVSRSELAAAVSEAGGLGVLGSGGMEPEELREQIQRVRSRTARTFGVNIPLVNVRPDGDADIVERLIEVVLKERVPVVVTGAGSPNRFTADLQAAGSIVLHVVPSVELARKCEAASVDAVIAEGTEAGGHIRADGLSTFVLIPQVVDAVSIPVVAAGGIVDARGVAAALSLGASGVQLGTRFIATVECNAHAEFKRQLQAASSEGTAIYSRSFHASRALLSPAVQELIELERSGCQREELLRVRGTGRARLGSLEGNVAEGIFPAGAGVGLVHSEQTVVDVVAELVSGARAILAALAAPGTPEWPAQPEQAA